MRLRKSSPCALNHSSTSASTSSVTDTSFSGIRRRASAKKASSNGGTSDVSIFSSVISLTLAQFAFEGFSKSRPLMLQRLSQRDDPKHVPSLRIDNPYDEIL